LTKAVTNDASRPGPHGLVAKILHWGTAGLLLFAYIDNGDVTNALRDPAAMRFEALVGLGVLVTFAARFVWMQRWNGGATRLPADAPWWEQRLSRLAHHSLYLCVAAIVASGLLIWGAQSFGGGGLVRAAAELHEFVAGATLFVIGGHVAAALWHKLVRRDGVWESIGTPGELPRFGWFRRAQ
jgi:cytochrome b561